MNVASLSSAPLARLRGVHHHYGRTPALGGLDLALPAGQVLALLDQAMVRGATQVATVRLGKALDTDQGGKVRIEGER